MGSERTIEGVTGSLRVSLQAPLSFGGFFFYRVLPAGLRVWTETFSFFFTFFFFFLCRGESCGTGRILRLFFVCVCGGSTLLLRFLLLLFFSSLFFFLFSLPSISHRFEIVKDGFLTNRRLDRADVGSHWVFAGPFFC